jgi:hypothetical protein
LGWVVILTPAAARPNDPSPPDCASVENDFSNCEDNLNACLGSCGGVFNPVCLAACSLTVGGCHDECIAAFGCLHLNPSDCP